MEFIPMWQATEKKAQMMFRVVDTPFATREECERSAVTTFGKGNYTVERIRLAANDPRL